jgi:transcriptional regulator with XRE-family HTH domain
MGRRRVTQADMVRITGLPQSTLSRTLSDQRDMGLDELQAIAEALGTNARAILDTATAAMRAED